MENKKVLLMILDGWGIGNKTKGDVIYSVNPPYITAMTEKYPHAELRTDVTSSRGVSTTTQLYRLAKAYHTHLVAILLTEEHHCTCCLCLLLCSLTILIEWRVQTNLLVHLTLHSTNLLIGHLLEVREVETESIRRHHRTLLLHVRTQHLAQCCVKKVGCCMVVCRTLTL